MTRRYRRNDADADALIPPLDAFSEVGWDDIAEFAASGARVAATDLKPWVDSTSKNDFYIDAGESADDQLYAAEYLYPRREPLSEASEAEGVWMVYFAELQNASTAQERLWRGIYNSSNTVEGYNVRMSKAYLFRGTFDELEEFAASLRKATYDWLAGQANEVRASGAYDEHEEYAYVRVYDDGDPEDISAVDCKTVVVQDTVFGYFYILAEEGDYDESTDAEGPFESQARAARAAASQARSADDRTYEERHMSADEVYLNRQPDPEDDMPHQEGMDCNRLRGTIAIVYQPKLKRLMRVLPDSVRSIDVLFGDSLRGHAYLDSESMGDCGRTHSPGSGVKVGTGDGMALYTGLATLAYQACERDCIGSCPTSNMYGGRSRDADKWWAAARARGLAREELGDCDSISLEDLIDAGLVFWMADEGKYAGSMAAAREKYAAGFAAAEPDPNPETLALIGEVLSQLIAEEDFAAWAAAHLPAAAREATPNRRRGRKPAFVTPELEAYVDELYAGLEGL